MAAFSFRCVLHVCLCLYHSVYIREEEKITLVVTMDCSISVKGRYSQPDTGHQHV